MTVSEMVKQEMDALSPEQQQEVLAYIQRIKPGVPEPRASGGGLSPERHAELLQVLASLSGSYGADLPADGAAAARELRRRVMNRSGLLDDH